jgi:sec-independent protein translocase protein TatC
MRKLLRVVTAPLRWLAAPFVWLWRRGQAVHRFFNEVPEDVSLTDTIGDALQSREALTATWLGIAEHLQALRQHLFRSVIALAITTAVCFTFAQRLMSVLAVPLGQDVQEQMLAAIRLPPLQALNVLVRLGDEGIQGLQVIEPTESIGVFMRVSLLAGVAFAMPWIAMELYLFIAPGLMPRSRVLLLIIIPTATVLFLIGLAFTYFVMLPAAIPFLHNFGGFRAAWRPSAYFALVTNLMFWIGLAFQMPLIIYALAAAGLVRADQLASQWRLAIVLIAILAAAVTPTVDPVNMGLVMLPMILLYFLSLLAAAVAQPRKRSAAGEAPAAS